MIVVVSVCVYDCVWSRLVACVKVCTCMDVDLCICL